MGERLLTAAQMRALERAAMESGAVTGRDLMERAGRGAVDAILAEWPDLATRPGRAVALCGPGNNGGDGFVVARLLADRGWSVTVLTWDGTAPSGDARANLDRLGLGIEVRPLPRGPGDDPGAQVRQAVLRDAGDCILIDALFGTGLSRPTDLPARIRDGLRATPQGRRPRIVALDIPSGLCADSGRALVAASDTGGGPPVLKADLTVAFGALKLGHVLGDAAGATGRLRRVDLGLTDDGDTSAIVRTVTASDVASAGIAKTGGHKYAYGHALILAGAMGRTGAARLSARAALRIGAGLVSVAAPGSAMLECAAQLTAIMLRRCDDGPALAALLEDDRLNALCLGPGLGTGARASDLVDAALAAGRATVLDADALTVLSGRPDPFAALHDRCVLTPHAGEFARLFPDIAARLDAPATEGPAFSKVDAVRVGATLAGCTLLLKGPDTVIADPSGRAAINDGVRERAAPWLATAGTGDVLSGIVVGLLARALDPFDAARTGAWLHVEAARAFGPGLIAEDLPERLPAVLAASAQDDHDMPDEMTFG